jgi:pimeloyl-ACP methyl ester carboxylesterase
VGNPGQLAPDVPAWVIARTVPEFGWIEPEKNAVDSRRLRFGGGLTGDLYFPANTPAGTKLPTVIWLHGDSYPLGYMWVYRRDLHPILALAKAGYAVLAFDQCGYGSRQGEAAPFYDRFPHWSQLGRMVEDTRAAIDALQKDAQVDGGRIYVFGYRTGATVGLYTAVFEPRVKGVVAVDGFHPLRSEVTPAGDSEIARLSQVRPLMPRLGLFAAEVRRIPFEYDDLLATLAPRPVLIVQPQMDQGDAPVQVRALVEHARRIYATSGPAERLALIEPDDYQRLPAKTQQRIIDWMAAQFGTTNPSK